MGHLDRGRHLWPGRAKREDEDDRKSVRMSIPSLVNREILKSIATAVKLRDDESGKTPPKMRLEAAQWIAGVGGVAPVKVVENLTRPGDDERPAALTPEAVAALSPEERRRLRIKYEIEQGLRPPEPVPGAEIA